METKTPVIEKISFAFPIQVLKFAESASGEFHVIGYAATTDFDLQGDVISQAAIQASSEDLAGNSTVLLNHDLNQPIGRVTKVDFDAHGLLIDALISQTVPDIISKIKEGVLNKFSIRGQVLERHQEYMAEYQKVVNVIDKMSLVEVSLVSVPANPEAKAIGWYVTKALQGLAAKGGSPMPKTEVEIEEMLPDPAEKETLSKAKKPSDDDEDVEKAEAEPNVGDKNGQDEIERLVTDGRGGRTSFQYARGKKGKGDEEDTEKSKPALKKNPYSMLAPMLDPIWPLLEQLIGQGGQASPLAQQIKVYLKRMVGDNSYSYPKPGKSVAVAISVGEDDEDGEGVDLDDDTDDSDAGMPSGKSKAPREADVQKMIAKEVRRQVRQQVEAALVGMPTVRKGLVQQEEDAASLKKQFDSLDPQQKLRVALAMQHP